MASRLSIGAPFSLLMKVVGVCCGWAVTRGKIKLLRL